MFQQRVPWHKKGHQTTLIPPVRKNYFKKYKRLIIISIVIIVTISMIFILTTPIIPVQETITKTRTRNLQFSSEDHYALFFNDSSYPSYVSVTNLDHEGGPFSVRITFGLQGFGLRTGIFLPFSEDMASTTESRFIAAGVTEHFIVPQNWRDINVTYDPTYVHKQLGYEVTAPTIQENYTVTTTEYKSIIDMFT